MAVSSGTWLTNRKLGIWNQRSQYWLARNGVARLTAAISSRVASPARPFEHRVPPMTAETEPDIRIRVEELLGPSPAPVDEIVRLSGAEAGAVQLILLELDLAGRLDRHAGGRVSLR